MSYIPRPFEDVHEVSETVLGADLAVRQLPPRTVLHVAGPRSAMILRMRSSENAYRLRKCGWPKVKLCWSVSHSSSQPIIILDEFRAFAFV